MNSIKLFYENAKKHPDKMAIADVKHGELSFDDILRLSSKVQTKARNLGLTKDDSVIVAIAPSPLLYGVICGLMGLGIRIVFIEPWLSLDRIGHVVTSTKPKAFFTSFMGKLWGARSKEIRSIENWITPADIHRSIPGEFTLEDLPEDHHAFVVFSSGTTGKPKGVIRTHSYMQNIYEIFTSLEPQVWDTPDLIIFPNVALFHLATGRGSVIVPHKWSERNIKKTLKLCLKYNTQTLSTGPAFLKLLLDKKLLSEFKMIDRFVIGGALTDCWLLESLIKTFPEKKFLHIYGGSEAEPVSLIDAKEALKLSQQKGFFQVLCVGNVVPQVEYQLREGVLWVSGPNVAGEYVGDKDENRGIKERDSEGKLWHCMGDRMKEDDGLLWYSGRESQRYDDFRLEQAIYSELNSSKAFLHRDFDGKLVLIGEKLMDKKILHKFPKVQQIIESKIYRDKRHRSRIDRKRSLPKSLRSK